MWLFDNICRTRPRVVLCYIVAFTIITFLNASFDRSYARYDKSITLFSPEGNLLQVEYAKEAGKRGASLLCARSAKDGEVMICIPSPPAVDALLDRRSIDKISRIDDGIWCAFSGLSGDGRLLIKEARKFCINFHSKFGSTPSVETVARFIGELQHESTLTQGRRPYGVQMVLIGQGEPNIADASDSGIDVFLTEPSGEVSKWSAIALGENEAKFNRLLEMYAPDAESTKDLPDLFKKVAGATWNDEENDGSNTDNSSMNDSKGNAVESGDPEPEFYRFYKAKGCQSTRRNAIISVAHYRSIKEVKAALKDLNLTEQ